MLENTRAYAVNAAASEVEHGPTFGRKCMRKKARSGDLSVIFSIILHLCRTDNVSKDLCIASVIFFLYKFRWCYNLTSTLHM